MEKARFPGIPLLFRTVRSDESSPSARIMASPVLQLFRVITEDNLALVQQILQHADVAVVNKTWSTRSILITAPRGRRCTMPSTRVETAETAWRLLMRSCRLQLWRGLPSGTETAEAIFTSHVLLGTSGYSKRSFARCTAVLDGTGMPSLLAHSTISTHRYEANKHSVHSFTPINHF